MDRIAACKCCGGPAPSFGRVDFHKSCESRRREVFPPSGILIEYHRCPSCRFLFTTDFDGFTADDLKRYIYNDDYIRVDPDYPEERPRINADNLSVLFPADRPRRTLDYGGGSGRLAELLRVRGFGEVRTYDPFVEAFAERPAGRFDLIVCTEVLEHATDPRRVLEDIAGLLDDPGMVLFTTLLQPPDLDSQGLGWWYVGPRNGHVSLFTAESLDRLAEPLGLHLASFNDSWHVLLRDRIPDFARRFVQPA
ncbi:class I SAM-dependent methyltransferase [Aquisphaera giovannonii]|nr:class I SAM-dependent methyltransferase [Aquisphaera giovannonii]